MSKSQDGLMIKLCVFSTCSISGILFAANQHELVGSLAIFAGLATLVWVAPTPALQVRPGTCEGKPQLHLHQHFHTTSISQVLPQFDRITLGREIDMCAGKARHVIRMERRKSDS